MKKAKFLPFVALLLFYCGFIHAQEGLIQEFEIKTNEMALERLARPGTPERSQISLERICSSELTTDWGIRSISNKSPYFQPLNYNYGAVWPFLTSWVTTALYKHNMPLQGYTPLLATAQHTFDNALGSITEVFSCWSWRRSPH